MVQYSSYEFCSQISAHQMPCEDFQMLRSNTLSFVNIAELPGASPPGPPPGRCPWTPPGALRRAPGPHAVGGSASRSHSAFGAVWIFPPTRICPSKHLDHEPPLGGDGLFFYRVKFNHLLEPGLWKAISKLRQKSCPFVSRFVLTFI